MEEVCSGRRGRRGRRVRKEEERRGGEADEGQGWLEGKDAGGW
jgi:hypothetical protein